VGDLSELSSKHQPEPSLASESEPPPPGVDDAEFTSDVFDDIVQKFESTLKPVSATNKQLEGHTEPSTVENVLADGIGAEGCEPQVVNKLFKFSGNIGLLGDAPLGFEADNEDDDYEVTSSEYDEYFDVVSDDFGENLDDLHTESFGGTDPIFGRPCEQFHPEFEDFTEDTLISEVLRASSYRPSEEVFAPLWGKNTCFRNPVGLGQVMPPLRHSSSLLSQPFRARSLLRSPRIACPPLFRHQRFPCNPPQRFPNPSDVPSSTHPPPVPWLRGQQFRPRIRPFIRPFPR